MTPRRLITYTTIPLALAAYAFLISAPDVYAASFWEYTGLLPKCKNGEYPGVGDNLDMIYGLDALIWLMVNIMKFILSIVGSLALGMFVYGGFSILMSAGDSAMITKGKKTLVNAVIGVGLVFSSWMIVNFFMASLVTGGDQAGLARSLEGTTQATVGQKVLSGVQLWQYATDPCITLRKAETGYVAPPVVPRSADGTVWLSGDQLRDIGADPALIEYNRTHSCVKIPPFIEIAQPNPTGGACASVCQAYSSKNATWAMRSCSAGAAVTSDAYCCIYIAATPEGTTCGTNAPCGSGYYCNASKCTIKLDNEKECTRPEMCKSGFCAPREDGVGRTATKSYCADKP